MNEEKKLNLKALDEETLAKITGGVEEADDDWTDPVYGYSRKVWGFIGANCIFCFHEGVGTCPYGTTDKRVCYDKAGSDSCPMRVWG